MDAVSAAGFQRMPVRQIKTVVQQPISAGFGQPAGFFSNGSEVNVAAVGDFFKAVIINLAQTALTVQKAAAGVGKLYFSLYFQFVHIKMTIFVQISDYALDVSIFEPYYIIACS